MICEQQRIVAPCFVQQCTDRRATPEDEGSHELTENEQKQQFSFAYCHTVAARAGYACQITQTDIESVDLTILAQGEIVLGARHSPRIEVQVKSTSQEVLREDHLPFPLPVKNYNELRISCVLPRILVVLLLPESVDDWLAQDELLLSLRHCAYWISLRGQAETTNQKTVTVHVPRAQLFSPEHLIQLMKQAAREEPLP